jgi:dolichol-phosphate mannosyltransferase
LKSLESSFFPVVDKLVGTSLPDNDHIKSVEVVIVDDGSRDHTFDGLKHAFDAFNRQNMSVSFVKHEVNRRLGAKMQWGSSGRCWQE